MTLDRQEQLLQEICAEYDLETVVNALCKTHGGKKVMKLAANALVNEPAPVTPETEYTAEQARAINHGEMWRCDSLY